MVGSPVRVPPDITSQVPQVGRGCVSELEGKGAPFCANPERRSRRGRKSHRHGKPRSGSIPCMHRFDRGALVPLSITLIVLLAVWLGIWGPVEAFGDKERTGIVKWLYDWQQLISGFLALAAAGVAAALVWKQLADMRRQATAAERQALLATDDLLTRRMAAISQVSAEIRAFTRYITTAVDISWPLKINRLEKAWSELGKRLEAIDRHALESALEQDAHETVEHYRDLARQFHDIIGQILQNHAPGAVPTMTDETLLGYAKNRRSLLRNSERSVARATMESLDLLHKRQALVRADLLSPR